MIRNYRQRGAALLFAMAALMTLVFVSVTATRESTVEYVIASNTVNRVRAYWAARAGIEMAFLRLNIYKQAVDNAPEAIKKQQNLLDLIWTFPVSFPFDETITAALGTVEKSELTKTEKASIVEGRYYVNIESEDSKLDINDLGSASKILRDKTREQLLQIFNNKLASDKDFAERYRTFNFDTLVNHMTDWIDADEEALEGGSEKSPYSDLKIEGLPPNQPFKTLDEVRSVASMNDELFELIKPQITVYGVKAINVNQADEKVLMSLNPQITEEVAGKILARRNDPDRGPFANLEDFLDFLSSNEGGNINVEKFVDNIVPLVFEATRNFRITSIGEYGNARRVIVAVTYDYEAIKNNLLNAFKQEDKKENPPADGEQNPPAANSGNDANNQGAPNAGNGEEKKPKKTPARPTIVYWNES